MKSHRILGFFFLCIMIAFSAVVSHSASADPSVLRVYMSGDYMPLHGMRGQDRIGIEAEIAEALASAMGKRLEYFDRKRAGTTALDAVAMGRVDIALNAITPTKERAKQVDFTAPIVQAPLLIATGPLGEGILSPKQLAGKTIAVVKGPLETQLSHLNAKLVAYGSAKEAVKAAAESQTHAVILEEPAMLEVFKLYPALKILEGKAGESPIAIAVPKGKKAEYDAVLVRIADDLKQIRGKWSQYRVDSAGIGVERKAAGEPVSISSAASAQGEPEGSVSIDWNGRISVRAVAFSHDGKYILSASSVESQGGRKKEEGEREEWLEIIELWEVSTGKEIRRFQREAFGRVYSVAFSPDDRYMLIWSMEEQEDIILTLREISTGKETGTFERHISVINSIAFSLDGKYMLSEPEVKYPSTDEIKEALRTRKSTKGLMPKRDHLMLSEISTGKEVMRLQVNPQNVYSIVFNPDGKYVLSGGYQQLQLWEVSTGKVIRTFKGHKSKVQSLAFSPDGKYAVSGSYDGSIILWDMSTGNEVKSFQGYEGDVTYLAFSPDGKYLLSKGSVSRGGIPLKLWNVSIGTVIKEFAGYKAQALLTSVVFSPDGKYMLASGKYNEFQLWEVSTGREIRKFQGHTGYVTSVAFSPNGKYALSTSGSELRLWDIGKGAEIAKFISFKDKEWGVITPDGYYNVSPNGAKHLKVKIDNKVCPIDKYSSKFYRPDIIQNALRPVADK